MLAEWQETRDCRRISICAVIPDHKMLGRRFKHMPKSAKAIGDKKAVTFAEFLFRTVVRDQFDVASQQHAKFIAVRKGEGAVALGNVLGSNIFNILGILGLTALVQPMVIPSEIANLDVWVLCATTLVLIAFARSGWTISRREGALFVLAYASYLGVLLT